MVTIRLEERLLTHTRDAPRTAIAAALEEGEREIVIDASATTEIDACGLGLLCRMSHRARELGATLTIRHPVGALRQLLRDTHLDSVLTVEYAT